MPVSKHHKISRNGKFKQSHSTWKKIYNRTKGYFRYKNSHKRDKEKEVQSNSEEVKVKDD
jgi:hypothetical protein